MKLGIFIDAANLYFCLGRKFNNSKLDYNKLFEFIMENIPGEVNTLHAYGTCVSNESDKFIRKLESMGYITEYVRLKKGKYTSLSTNIFRDVMLADIEGAIICSASKDIQPIVEYLNAISKPVWVIGCGLSYRVANLTQTFEIGKELLEDSEIKKQI